jgi:hypothetical protein
MTAFDIVVDVVILTVVCLTVWSTLTTAKN